MKSAYAISLLPDGRNLSIEYSFRSPEENMAHILSFDSYIPQIHDLIDQIQEEKTKENLIRNMMFTIRSILQQIQMQKTEFLSCMQYGKYRPTYPMNVTIITGGGGK
jgi:hypothetical protein